MPGHCLGSPQNRDKGAVPERNLSSTQCALLKLLLHLTMYLGCGNSTKGICSLIKPEIDEKTVYRFIWDHIVLDIQDLQGALTLNVDEVLLISHSFVDAILKKGICEEATHGAAVNIQSGLSTKEERDEWENQFAGLFCREFVDQKEIKKTLVNVSELLQNSNGLLAMLNMCMNEISEDPNHEGAQSIDKNPKVWVYQTSVSLKRLGQTLHRKLSDDENLQNSYPMLEVFLERQLELKTIRFVPSILKLHKTLLRRYSRNIFKSEALDVTVAQMKNDKIAGDETDSLFEDLIEAWNNTRKVLNNFIVRTDKGARIVNQEMSADVSSMNITDDTALVYLLPTTEGKGICSYALLDLLIQNHNDVIERYKYSDRGQRDTFPAVQPKDITSAHVINYHPEDDLLPIVIANCSVSTDYSTEDEFDFEKIEKKIVERFISTKSIVIKKNILQIELMTYRSSITPASKLENLKKKIVQEPFDTVVKTTLCSEIRDVPVISQILSKVDIAINFLDITGGDQDELLHDFMTDRLKMNRNVLTPKMQQSCSLKHVRALWLALSLHRSNIMVQLNKPTEMIFESIEPQYHEPVPAIIQQVYTKYLQVLPKERLFQILEVVYEFITVVLTEAENKEEEDYVDRGRFSLDDCLGVFTEDINVPDNILCVHVLHFWIEVSRMYDIRMKERTTTV